MASAVSAGHESAVQSPDDKKIITRVSIDFLRPKLQSLQAKTPRLEILDCGTGYGSSTWMLGRAVPSGTLTAIDINPQCLARARDFCRAGGVDGVTFREANAKHLPFPDDTFDVVFCHQLLVHVAQPWEVIREMVRVAKPGGVVAAREGDFETEAIWPKPAGSDKMHRLVAGSLAKKGGDPEGGRKLLDWALKAGFARDQVSRTYSPWLCQTTDERKAWVQQITAMLRDSSHWLSQSGVGNNLTSLEDHEEIAKGWEAWAEDDTAHLVMLNAEVIMEKPKEV